MAKTRYERSCVSGLVVKLRLFLIVLLIAPLALWAQDESPAPSRHSTKKSSSSSKKKTRYTTKKMSRKLTPAQRQARALRARRAMQAFVASAELKPMAQQLLETRTPAAYAGVEKWARSHPDSEAGALAWLAIGYARYTDRDYDKAMVPLQNARPNAGELGDYVTYFLAASYLNRGNREAAFELLATFAAKYPDSVFRRDAALMYGNALLTAGNAQRAVAVLAPFDGSGSPDVELALGRACLRAGQQQ